jgi:hypothetical protein
MVYMRPSGKPLMETSGTHTQNAGYDEGSVALSPYVYNTCVWIGLL